MVYLTSTDRQELHTAILEYLSSSPSITPALSSETLKTLEDKLSNNSTTVASASTNSNSNTASSSSALERRWATFKRLTLANTQLEDKCKKLEMELANSKNPMMMMHQQTSSSGTGTRTTNSNQHLQKESFLPTGPKPIHQFKGHRDVITCIAVHPFEPLIFSGSSDATVRVWNTHTKKIVQKFATSGDRINSLSIEPVLGEMLAVGVRNDENGFGIYVYENNVEDNNINNNNNNDEGNLVISASSSVAINHSCTKSLRHVCSLSSSSSGASTSLSEDVTCVSWCVSEKEQRLISCSDSGSVCVWSIDQNSNKNKLKAEIYINNEQTNGTTTETSASLKRIMSCATSTVTRNLFVAVGCSDQSIFLLNIHQQNNNFVGSSSDNNKTSSSTTNSIVVGKSSIIHSNAITSLSFISSQEGETCLVEKYGNPERRAQRREWAKNIISNQQGSMNNSNNDNPQFLVSCGRDKNIVLSDLQYNNNNTNRAQIIPLWKYEGHGGWVNSIVVLPFFSSSSSLMNNNNNINNSVFVVSASDDDTIRVIDLRSAKEVKRITDDSEGSHSCLSIAPTVSSSKLLMCSGGVDRLISVWGFEKVV